jgi:predicted MFS family arabinose efflux permease
VAIWAALTPATKPDEPEGIGTLVRALGDRRIRLAFWLIVLPALAFGTLSVLASLRLGELGFGAVAIGAVWLVTAGLETANNIWIGRLADRFGPLRPIHGALIASIAVAALLPWPDRRFELAALIVCAGLAFGSFYTPGMTLLTNAAEARGLNYGYAFALMNLAWAPGQAGGAALGGAVAEATSDAVPYLTLSGLALITLRALRRFMRAA